MAISILLSTCEKYKDVAAVSISLLNRYWKNHPDIFLCGLISNINDCQQFPLEGDTRDWMTITHDACVELVKIGFNKTYLILDDHPPLAPCHSVHLNVTLPEMMDRLQSSLISLYGWGQRGGTREQCGVILGENFFNIEQLPREYPWKFSLHPGLWDLKALISILEQLLVEINVVEDRTPWKFERISGTSNFEVSEELKSSTYRVCGKLMTDSQFRFYLHQMELLCCDVAHYIAKKLFGKDGSMKLYASLAHIYHYYEGPYPIFWSGIVAKGSINAEFKRFLVFHGKDTNLANTIKTLTLQ